MASIYSGWQAERARAPVVYCLMFIVCLINNTYLIGRLKGREHPLYSSNALIYDAVQVLSKALNDLASMEVITETMVDVTYSW